MSPSASTPEGGSEASVSLREVGEFHLIDRVTTGRSQPDTTLLGPGDDSAVVAAPDEHWGEAVCAVVVPRRRPPPTADDLVAHVRSRLAAFKRPRHVLFVDELPMTPNGKVAKDEVRRHVRERLTPQTLENRT